MLERKSMKRNRLIAWIMIGALTTGIMGCGAAKDAGVASSLQMQDWERGAQPALYTDYEVYLSTAGTAGEASDVLEIAAADFVSEEGSGAYLSSYMGEDGCLYWDTAGGSVTWEFDVAEEGLYNLALTYCGISGKNYDIVLDVLLDGEIPFENAKNVSLRRLFLDETYFGMADNAFAKDARGGDVRPALMEQYEWQTEWLTDSATVYPGPLQFYLTEGRHTVTLMLKEESVALKALHFGHADKAAAYEEVLQGWMAEGAADSSGYYAEYEAEKSYLKNDITLFATYDTANVHVTPSSASAVYYNTIGKNTWKEVGQEITWEFEVPQDGFYYIAFKVKQNEKSNAYSVREISIDGSVLCEEMAGQKFPYQSGWYVKELTADGEPMKIYLTAGHHVLGMKADMDEELAEVLRGVEAVTKDLQHWYREIIKVTGFNADGTRITIDLNRDFDLEKNIPGLLEGLQDCKERLEYYYSVLEGMEGLSGAGASTLKEMAETLKDFLKRPGKIAKRIETFRSNISNLATWRIDMQAQPLTMDKFMVYSPDMDKPKVGGGAWKQLVYRFSMFLDSFAGETNAISGSGTETGGDKKLRVWISTADITTTGASSGRDQAILLKKLIDESFSVQTGVPVEVSLVSGSDTLVQAVLAGEGPDVALFTSVDTPVNLAMRGALLDLSRYDDFEEVIGQFTPSAVTPFWYKDGCYAFPETQNFNVLFYRTDIYEELGLCPPATWDEFYEQVILLANENYMVGVPQNQNIFETFLYQQGGRFYSEDMSSSMFHTGEALSAFDGWTGLYTKYSLSLVFDFFNRFRSGEMALAIEPYNQVNYLYSAAPELNGLWDIAVMPGTPCEDGINYVETSTSTGAIALADTAYPDEAYAFLKWWVSAETQSDFGVQVEQTLGVAARYGTANLAAFENLPWNSAQAEVIRRQRENTVAVEQIPGSYYIARNLAFAFRGVVYGNSNLRETLYKYNIEINKELQRKQKEFNY